MITVKNKIFTITTKNTSYICRVREDKYVENLYYGRKIGPALTDESLADALSEKFNNPYGNAISIPAEEKVTLDNLSMELSNAGTGDYRMQPFVFEDQNGSISTRFYFKESFLYEGIYRDRDKTGMPYAKWDGKDFQGEKPWTLELIFEDEDADATKGKIELRLIYTSFDSTDTITRRTVITNKSDKKVTLRGAASMQLDLPGKDYTLLTFDGLWTRERHKQEKKLVSGIYETGSNNGTSSNVHNPFIMLRSNDASEDAGDCYAFNLIYSGNHRERVEVSEYNKTRIITGINDYSLATVLESGHVFYTPEAVLTFSHQGLNGASNNCHRFVENHIIPYQFRRAERPILANNWEATYFDFNKKKLLKLAKDASNLGMELFVLDDGWFGHRDDDKSSLGDWTVNEKKLGGKLSSLIKDIKAMGLEFGIWIEPEMISEESELYKKNPDWAVRQDNREHYLGRNQMVLDYTNEDVRDYIVGCIGKLLRDNDISYVKWDMNRPITDTVGAHGSFFHNYVLGLYDVMKRLTDEFPDVLFEGCSAGGNRFDLGILSFMPQIWTSDDTDPNERIMIQGGTSYGYPQSSMGAHVSAAPNHQTLRLTSIDTRFGVAAMGVLGYELDLTVLTPNEKKSIKAQVEFYKKYRNVLQFGRFSRVVSDDNTVIWQTTSDNKDKAVILLYKKYAEPNQSYDILKAKDLDSEASYKVTTYSGKVSIKQFGNLVNQISPVKIKEEGIAQAAIDRIFALNTETAEYTVSGAALMYAGIKLNSRFVGTGMEDGTRVMGDYSSRLYTVEKLC